VWVNIRLLEGRGKRHWRGKGKERGVVKEGGVARGSALRVVRNTPSADVAHVVVSQAQMQSRCRLSRAVVCLKKDGPRDWPTVTLMKKQKQTDGQ